MKKHSLAAGLALALSVVPLLAAAHGDGHHEDRHDSGRVTVAVFGDWPYKQNLMNNAALLINSVNADREVDAVLHVGDIHAGSQPCTSAGILPTIPTADPGWSVAVYNRFQQFNAPVIYTPGDNEWTDCHKSKEGSSGAPLKELASVRELFFAKAGRSLGRQEMAVSSQALDFDAAYPADAQFVENVMWRDGKVVFATIHMPGSNNDTKPWTGDFSDPDAQQTESEERTAADIRWLQATFAKARHEHAKVVVIAQQADMWDPEAVDAYETDGYQRYVQALADLAESFGGPVLLLNGDSHVYGFDRPLADPASATGQVYNTQPVPNLTRITVQGSTNAPAEWLRLTIDPSTKEVFSWTNVPYCADPSGSCQ